MARMLQPHSHVVVVDSQPSGYHTLVALAEAQLWHTHFLTSGSAAIQIARRLRGDLWMIHVSLPDMSGFDLYEIVREQLAEATTFMISNQYSADDEGRSCGIGADLYLCKDDCQSLDCESLLKPLMSLPTNRLNLTADHPAMRPP
jgi:DNA-binding response OmpR family regulator